MNFFCKIFTFFLFFIISLNVFSGPVIQKLQNDTPKTIIPMHKHLKSLGINASYTSDVYYLEFDDGLKAVFKTYDDEEENIKQNEAELISYKLDLALDLNFVPRTCIRELDIDSIFKKGCIKEYIENFLKFENEEKFISFLENNQNLEKLNAVKIFFFILGQYDCSHHNLFITQHDEDYNFHAIDNGEIHKKLYVQLGHAPFTPRGYVEDDNSFQCIFPFDDVEEFASPLVEKIKNKFFGKRLPQYFMKNLENFEKNNPGKVFPMVHYKNIIWMQVQGSDIDFFWKNITHCPATIKEKLQYWYDNPEQLDILFEGISFYDAVYKKLLLDRIRQILTLSSGE